MYQQKLKDYLWMMQGSITSPRRNSGFGLAKFILVPCAFIAHFLSHHNFVPWEVLLGRFDIPCFSSQIQRKKGRLAGSYQEVTSVDFPYQAGSFVTLWYIILLQCYKEPYCK